MRPSSSVASSLVTPTTSLPSKTNSVTMTTTTTTPPPPPLSPAATTHERRLIHSLTTFAQRLSLHLASQNADDLSNLSSPPTSGEMNGNGNQNTEQSEAERMLVYNDFYHFLFEEDKANIENTDVIARAMAHDDFLIRMSRVSLRDAVSALKDNNYEYCECLLRIIGSCMCLAARTARYMTDVKINDLASLANGLIDLVHETITRFENRQERACKDLARCSMWCIGNMTMPFSCSMDKKQSLWETIFIAADPTAGFNSVSVMFESLRAIRYLIKFHPEVIDKNLGEFLAALLVLTTSDESEQVHDLALDLLWTRCNLDPDQRKHICSTLLRREDVKRAAVKITTQYKLKLQSGSTTSPDSVASNNNNNVKSTKPLSPKLRQFWAKALGPWIFWLCLHREYMMALLEMLEVFFSKGDPEERCLAFSNWRFVAGHLVHFSPYSPTLFQKLLGRVCVPLYDGKEPAVQVRLAAFNSWACVAWSIFSTPDENWRSFITDSQLVTKFYEPLVLALHDFDLTIRARAAEYAAKLLEAGFTHQVQPEIFAHISESILKEKSSKSCFPPYARQKHGLRREQIIPTTHVVAKLLNASLQDFTPVFGEDRAKELRLAMCPFWMAVFRNTGGGEETNDDDSISTSSSSYMSTILQDLRGDVNHPSRTELQSLMHLPSFLSLIETLHDRHVECLHDAERIVEHVCELLLLAYNDDGVVATTEKIVEHVIPFCGGIEAILHMIERGSIAMQYIPTAWRLVASACVKQQKASSRVDDGITKAMLGLPLSDACWRFFLPKLLDKDSQWWAFYKSVLSELNPTSDTCIAILAVVSSECLSESWFACKMVECLCMRDDVVKKLHHDDLLNLANKMCEAIDDTPDDHFVTDRVVLLAETIKRFINPSSVCDLCHVMFGGGGRWRNVKGLAHQKLTLEVIPIILTQIAILKQGGWPSQDFLITNRGLEECLIEGLHHPDLGIQALCDEFVGSEITKSGPRAMVVGGVGYVTVSPRLVDAWKSTQKSMTNFIMATKSALALSSIDTSSSPGSRGTKRASWTESQSPAILKGAASSPSSSSTWSEPTTEKRVKRDLVLTERQKEKLQEHTSMLHGVATYTSLDLSQERVVVEHERMGPPPPRQPIIAAHHHAVVADTQVATSPSSLVAMEVELPVTQGSSSNHTDEESVIHEYRELAQHLVKSIDGIIHIPTHVVREDSTTRERIKHALQMLFGWVVKEGFAG